MKEGSNYWYTQEGGDFKLDLDDEDVQFLYRKSERFLSDMCGEVNSDVIRMCNMFYFEKSKLTKEYFDRMKFSEYNVKAIKFLITY